MYSPVKECYCGCPEFSAAGSYANVHCWAQSLVIRVLKDSVLQPFFQCRLAGYYSKWPTRPLFSPSLWSVLCKFSFLKVDFKLFFFLKLSRWWFSAQPCVLITTYPLINFPHSVSVNVYVAFVLPTNHSSPPIFPFPLPSAFFPLASTHPAGRSAWFMSHRGGYGPDLHCWAEAAELLKRIPCLVWAADSSCVIIVLFRDAKRNLSLFNWRSFLILERQDSWYDSEFEDDVAYVNKWKSSCLF